MKLVKRFSIVMISLFVVITVYANFNVNKTKAGDYPVTNPKITNGKSTWDCVYFGTYPQTSKGNGKFYTEKIMWRVLYVNGNDMYLLSDKILDAQAFDYDNYNSTTTWSSCSLRRWLNNEFYNTAFSTSEKTDIISKGSDKVSLLSPADASTFNYGFNRDFDHVSDTRMCKTTDYAKYKGCEAEPGYYYSYCSWWLNTIGKDNSRGACVTKYGQGLTSGYEIYIDDTGVRPAIHVSYSSSNWTYAETVESKGAGQPETTTTKQINTTVSASPYVYYNNNQDRYNKISKSDAHRTSNSTKIKIIKIKSNRKSLKVFWKKSKNAKGYILQYSKNRTFKKAKNIIIENSSKHSTRIKALKKKTRYYIRIRAYNNSGSKFIKYVWSTVKSKKTK